MLLLIAACGRPHVIVAPTTPATGVAPPTGRLTDNVVLVSIDGLRPDAIAAFSAPTLRRLIAEGSYTLAARTIVPSKTLPSHTSMLTGEPPDRHGVLWNDTFHDEPGTIELPTVFSVARARGYSTAAFFSKAKFSHLQRPGTLDYSQAPGGWFGLWSAAEIMGDVEGYLAKSAPNLLFVHLTDPDTAGHGSGWMSERYGRAVLSADTAVSRLMRVADKAYGASRYTMIVTADHGGHDQGHGSDHPLDVAIPWIAWGQGVWPGQLQGPTVETMDTASTVLYLLGLEAPVSWAGEPIRRAFGVVATHE